MENQQKDKYGNVTFGEASRLLIDIIGQNAIFESMQELKLMREEDQEAFKRSLERMYNGQAVYSKFATAERGSPQWYITQFFEMILEEKYKLSRLAMIIVDSFTWQLFNALTCTAPFEKPKKETALFLIRKEIFLPLIFDTLIKGEPFDDGTDFKRSGNSIIKFLTDSYDKIFSEVETLYKNKETFYRKLNIYCKNETTDYKQNIINWRNKNVYNANWKILVPVLDFLLHKNKKDLVHRLIGLYLLKNTQKALKEVLDISEQEQEKIITDILTMVRENKRPEEFYDENGFFFPLYQQVNLINMCLAYQHQENFDTARSDKIIKFIEEKCVNSKKFFSPWCKARASVFEKGETLKENKEEQEKIIEGYKKAYDEGVAYAGAYLAQFLLEAIIINKFYKPKHEKDVNDYHGYGYALELFGPEKEKLLDIIKDSSDLRTIFDDIHYSHLNPLVQNILQNYPDLHSILESSKEAMLINIRGLEFEKMDNFDLAIQCFSEAIMLNPVYVNAYSNRGNVYKKMSEYIENALTDLNLALLLDPKHENTLFNRGLLFLEKGQYENAITDFTNFININPEDSEAYFTRGNCYMYLENLDLAIKDYSKAIEINPNYVEAYHNRGIVYHHAANDDKAQEDLRKVMEKNPKHYLKIIIEEIFNEGFFYNFKLKDNDMAIAAFTEAIKIDPKSSPAYLNRGSCYFKIGNYDKAILDYDTALSLNPQNINVYKKHEWALYLKKWAENYPNHIDVLTIVNRAIENAQKREYDLALNDFEQALKLCSNNAYVFHQRGLMYDEIKDSVNAFKDFRKTIELAPTVAGVYYDRGNMYLHKEIYDKAIEDYTMAITIYPKFCDAIRNRGIAFLSQKKYELAIDDFNLVLQINPDNEDAKLYLQKIRKIFNYQKQ